MSRSGANVGVIGLDVCSRHIAAVQLTRGGEIAAAARFSRVETGLPLSARESDRIAEILDRQGFRGKQVSVGLPDPALMWASFSLPPRSSGAPIDSLAVAELASNAGLSVDQITAGCWDAPDFARSGEQTQVVAVGCGNDNANEFLEPLDRAGFDVVSLYPRPCAAVAACEPMVRPGGGLVALIEIGDTGSSPQLLIAGLPIYHRCTSEIGVDHLLAEIEKRLGFDRMSCEFLIERMNTPSGLDTDAGWVLVEIARLISTYLDTLSDEIHTALNYASYRYPQVTTDRVILFGQGARLPGVREHVGQQIGYSPMIATPSRFATCPSHVAHITDDPALIVALGLARHGGEP